MGTPEEFAPPNSAYGQGIYRRRTLLSRKPGAIEVVMEDCSHAMKLLMQHQAGNITDLQGEVIRAPVTSCRGAPGQLTDLIGLPLSDNADIYRQHSPQHHHCTHLYDMALLAIEFAQREEELQQFDVAVGDEVDGAIDGKIFLNHRLIHHWVVRQGKLAEPTEFAGQSAFKGFAHWAKSQFSGDALLCAFGLQRGLMVANARRWDMAALAGEPADTFCPPPGACYSYSKGREKTALRTANPVRDFSDTPEQLLRFI